MVQKIPAIATVVSFGVSFLHLKLTENIENPNELEIKHPKSSNSFPSQENEIKNERLSEPIQRKINERRRKNESRSWKD